VDAKRLTALNLPDLKERARYLSQDKLLQLIDIFLQSNSLVVASCLIAIHELQLEQVQTLAHKLKGSASQVGAILLYEYCDEIINAANDPQHFPAEQCAQQLRQIFDQTKSELLLYASDAQAG